MGTGAASEDAACCGLCLSDRWRGDGEETGGDGRRDKHTLHGPRCAFVCGRSSLPAWLMTSPTGGAHRMSPGVSEGRAREREVADIVGGMDIFLTGADTADSASS